MKVATTKEIRKLIRSIPDIKVQQSWTDKTPKNPNERLVAFKVSRNIPPVVMESRISTALQQSGYDNRVKVHVSKPLFSSRSSSKIYIRARAIF